MTSINIQFDSNPQAIYYSGQQLSGSVKISLDRPKKVRGVYVEIHGFAKCHWTESESRGSGKNRRTVTVSYDGHEDYLLSKTFLSGSQNGQTFELPSGVHTYTFACVLPPQVPTSFEGGKGHIRYTIRVVMDRPWKFDNTAKVAFTVLRPYDLNYEPLLRTPCQSEITKTFCCFLCASGPLLISASIPKTGYVPGETIVITSNINNTSDVDVESTEYVLQKTVRYFSQTPRVKSRTEVLDIIEKRSPGVKQNDRGSYEQVIVIPSLPPTNLLYCRVIQITYAVLIRACVSGCHSNPQFELPITIGTVPLLGEAPQPQYDPNYSQKETEAGGHGGPPQIGFFSPAGPSNYNNGPPQFNMPHPGTQPSAPSSANIPPPSYEETVYGTKKLEGDGDDPNTTTAFNPSYPVYHIPYPPTAPLP